MSGQPRAYKLLKKFLHLSTSSLPIETRLEEILHSISEVFRPDQCLVVRADQIGPGGFFSRVASEKKDLWMEEETSIRKGQVLPEEERFLCSALTCLLLSEQDSFQGILCLGFSKRRDFLPEEVDLLLLLAKGIGGLLRNEALRSEAEQTITELTAVHDLGKAVTSTLKPEDLFELIIRSGVRILRARGGVVRIEDKKTGGLKVKFSMGGYDQNPLDEEMARKVFFSRSPLSLNPLSREKRSMSVLCVPLLSEGRSFGTLAFYEKETDGSGFNDQDFHLLLTMASQISCSVENAMTHFETSRLAQDHEKSVKRLSTLCELNKTLLTTVQFERILELALTAITIGEGLGFNRAMLFLVDEKRRALKGTIAVGPDSAQEAGRIWEALSYAKGSPSVMIPHLEPPPKDTSQLDRLVKGIEIPLEYDQCVLAKTVLEGRPFHVQVSQSEGGLLRTGCEGRCCLNSLIGCYGGRFFSSDPQSYAFATVPLWGKGRVIGVVLVDNLYNQNPIEDEDLQFLGMFANQTGLAIENALLYRNLEVVHQELKEAQSLIVHQEKMAALGELSNTIAHEIKNPLTAIGGFARRLGRTMVAESPEKRYAQTIIQEVARLEKVLNDINHYTHAEAVTFGPQDLSHLLEDSLSLVENEFGPGKLQLVKEFSEGVPEILGDYHQLKYAFYNLIKNACESMDEKGTLSIRLYPYSRNGTAYARLEVKDTGRGINPENLSNIFNPFYSTKESSSGLGLPIVHKVIVFHQGRIEVDNHPGEGVTFIITFPAFGKDVRNPNHVDKDRSPSG
jgi:two-component system, NtrC family, sensor histidine kinase HydH